MKISLIFVGLILSIVNSVGLLFTVKRIAKKKSGNIIFASFLLRMLIIFLTFYIFLDGMWQNMLNMFIGLAIGSIANTVFIKKKLKDKK